MEEWLKLVHLEDLPLEKQLFAASTYYDLLTNEPSLETWTFEQIAETQEIIYNILVNSQEKLGMFHPTTVRLNDAWYRISKLLFKVGKKEHEELSKCFMKLATL